MSYALITGASKGIGAEMAYCLAGKKYDLLLVARSEKLLQELSGSLMDKYQVKVKYLVQDVAEKGAADKMVNWVKENNCPVNVLINNAGYGLWGNFDELRWDDQENMLSLNVMTLAELTHKMIPVLAHQSGRKYILNVGSMAGFQPVPGLTLYAATKSLVNDFTLGLRWELRKKDISVTLLAPGGVRTNFIDRAGMQHIADKANQFSMNPDVVAKAAIHAMLKGKRKVIPGFGNRLSLFFERLVPGSLVEKISASLYQKK